MYQWYLIAIAINAQNFINEESWIDSFKNINIHPHTRSTFDVWIRKFDNCGFLSAEKFFEKRTNLYDAMPACWKKLNVDQLQAIMGIISDAYNSIFSNQNVWRKKNILSLARFVNLEYVFKLRTCYLTAKLDLSIIVRLKNRISVTVRMTLLLPLTNSALGNLEIYSQNIKRIKQTSQCKKSSFFI